MEAGGQGNGGAQHVLTAQSDALPPSLALRVSKLTKPSNKIRP